jgi:SAM-dependent methyltransferase
MITAERLPILACSQCGSKLRLIAGVEDGAGQLQCQAGHSFPVVGGIPRFVPPDNYADSFGFQWRAFSRVQLDSVNGTQFSAERFQTMTGWTEQDLAGKRVLDAGCGAGRFAEVVLKLKADLVACDLSAAIDVCRENVAPHTPLLCQASIYELPFPDQSFDFVYCIGVAQHTPDPLKTVRSLCRKVRPGGQIGLWIYERDWKSYIGTLGFKYALRPWFRRLPRSRQFAVCKKMVDFFYPLAAACRPLGTPGKIVMRLLPVASAHVQSVPLSLEDFKTWILLDTFDMYSPAYDQPQTYATVARVLNEENFEDIRRHPHGGISITATRRTKD